MPTRLLLQLGLVAVGLAVLALGVLAWLRRGAPDAPDAPPALAARAAGPATYVGRDACASCHATQQDAWTGSHHDLAMAEATEATVLGDFDDAEFTHGGVTSTFFRRGDGFFVRTDGPDGAMREYPIAYTFGVAPLQQYLIAFPGGRYQALGICWDARPAAQGGQRWFHLYPDEAVPAGDELHWTGPNQNWNFMCAECHSTNLRKGYDAGTDQFATTWAEIDVSCEACHGPASRHVAWAETDDGNGEPAADDGLMVHFPKERGWVFELDAPTAKRVTPLASRLEVEACARCHARRALIDEAYVPGRPLLDTHLPAWLEETLYYPDGQIEEEVYVYGSFVQSKMHAEGVTCSDCHDPHGLAVHAPGNALCARCHQPAVFDGPAHHFHEPGTPGASCVECHMPARTYMVVDPRRDHSLRVPRPDLSVRLGTPNACNGCHRDQTAGWAAAATAEWYGPDRRAEPHYGAALHAGRTGARGAQAALVALAAAAEMPAIARASALALLARYPEMSTLTAAEAALGDADPLVRVAALRALDILPPAERGARAGPLLRDPVRAVRIEAARSLAPATRGATPGPDYDRAFEELLAAHRANAERAESHSNLGVVLAQRGQSAEAEAAYRHALRLDPAYVRAALNLADLYRELARDDDAERVLRETIAVARDTAMLHHVLGMVLVRQQRLPEAVASLAEAARLQPENARLRYAYALALDAQGETDRALRELELALEHNPNDRELLTALATMHRDAGAPAIAAGFARRLVELYPEDAGLRRLLQSLPGQ